MASLGSLSFNATVSAVISRSHQQHPIHPTFSERNQAVRYQPSTGEETGDCHQASGDLILFQISTQWPRRGVSMSCSLAFALTWEISGFYISAVLKSDLLTRWLTLIWNRDLWDCLRCSTLIPHPHSITHLDNRGCKYKNLNSLLARLAFSSLPFKQHFCLKLFQNIIKLLYAEYKNDIDWLSLLFSVI